MAAFPPEEWYAGWNWEEIFVTTEYSAGRLTVWSVTDLADFEEQMFFNIF